MNIFYLNIDILLHHREKFYKKLIKIFIYFPVASRWDTHPSQKEIVKCKEAGVEFIELPVAFDALTVVINPANDFAKEMTVAELKTIWGPEAQETITSFKE